MRIICPNCDAQYEVDDAAIPAEGRDVQCSNCGHAWFQTPAVTAESLSSALYEEPAQVEDSTDALEQGADEREVPEPPMPPKRSLDEALLSVLREEAEREVQARKAEAESLEMQGDLGLPPPVNPAVGRNDEQAKKRPFFDDDDEDEEAPEIVEEPPAAPAEPSATRRRIAALKGLAVPSAKPGARRDLLPDIEEINSSLKPSPSYSRSHAQQDERPNKESGFRSGFTLMLLVAGLGGAVYLMAPQIAEQIPELAGAMETYVAAVDAGRAYLDGLIRQATEYLRGMT